MSLKSLPVVSIEDVVERQLCTGCGVCEYLEPDRYQMSDVTDLGRRPIVRDKATATSNAALESCPGVRLSHDTTQFPAGTIVALVPGWGPVLEVWEGYSGDEQIRLAGSSGGAATSLALHCLEHEGMAGVLHTGARKDVPYLNETVFSQSREDLLSRAGSRYSPASPCDRLSRIEQEPAPSVFIGKPCDVAAVHAARKGRPQLDQKLGLTLAFFCAGTPSTKGLFELMKQVGVADPATVTFVKFRGNGWPGMWTVRWGTSDGETHEKEMTYADSWGFLQKYRQWRCYICPDHTGEFADIAVGDPWYRPVEPGEAGKSLIIVRTERGREILKRAVASGKIVLETSDPSLLPRSQPNLLQTRGKLWGRLWALRMFGGAVPQFQGFSTFRFWLKLSMIDKVRSFTGTVKRIKTKRLNKRIKISS